MQMHIIPNTLYNEDCKLTLKRMLKNSIDGIITSPPYNINTERSDCYYNNGYSELDGLSENDYLEVRTKEFKEFSRVIKDKGVICYNISYAKENPILPTLLVAKVHKETDLTLADIITWKKKHAIPFQTSPTKLSRITELIYVFVKKDFLHDFTTNKQVSKVNEKTGQKFYKNYVNFIEAKNNDGFKSSLKAAYSQDLVDQLIDIYFPKGSYIYDPFSGIGTTQLSCRNKGCDYIGSELIKEHFNDAIKRIFEDVIKKLQEKNGNLMSEKKSIERYENLPPEERLKLQKDFGQKDVPNREEKFYRWLDTFFLNQIELKNKTKKSTNNKSR